MVGEWLVLLLYTNKLTGLLVWSQINWFMNKMKKKKAKHDQHGQLASGMVKKNNSAKKMEETMFTFTKILPRSQAIQ